MAYAYKSAMHNYITGEEVVTLGIEARGYELELILAADSWPAEEQFSPTDFFISGLNVGLTTSETGRQQKRGNKSQRMRTDI